MIEFSSKKDIDDIFDLWRICFGDEDEYIRFFLENRFNPERTLIKRVGVSIVSMLFLLEGKVCISGEKFSSYYIYAACTHPDFRKKGYMESLIKSAKRFAAETAVDFISLVPASESLFSYYGRFGFVPAFKRKEITISRKQLMLMASQGAENASPDIKEIYRFRNRVLSSSDFFLWDEKAIDYAIRENELTNGRAVFAATDKNLCSYALFHEIDGSVLVNELCFLNGKFGDIAALLLAETECDNFRLSLPVVFPISSDNNTVRSNAMIFPVSDRAKRNIGYIKNAYFGLTLE